MSGVADGHQDVTRRPAAGARVALAAQPDGLAFLDPDRDRDIERLSSGQGDADRAAVRDRLQGNRDRDADIVPPGRSRARAAAAGAEQFRQDVRVDRAAFGRKPAAPEVEAEVAEVAAAGSRGAPETETLELRRARLALCVDLAVVEGLALLLVAEDFIG
jgi:hypothetical protein